MKIKNNYNETLTNLACSILKYFGASYSHTTIDYIDTLLDEKQPKNVVTILLDGMGSSILNKHLEVDSFFYQNKIKDIITVFPATTVAATTSIRTGLNPCETGMLGWTMFFDECQDTIVTFAKTSKGDETWQVLKDADDYSKKYLTYKEVTDKINDETINHGYRLTPFDENAYKNLDDMFIKLEELCRVDEKKYIYAYNDEPDHTMHDLGTDDEIIKNLILERQDKIFELSKRLNDTVIFVIAEHGHLNAENIMLEDYPDFIDCLRELPSIEPRATAFFVKDGKNLEFEQLFNKYFNEYFYLYTKEEVIEAKIFGDGIENPKFRNEIGDYLAISHTKKAFISKGDYPLKSQHAGYSDEEIYIPLIAIDTNKVN